MCLKRTCKLAHVAVLCSQQGVRTPTLVRQSTKVSRPLCSAELLIAPVHRTIRVEVRVKLTHASACFVWPLVRLSSQKGFDVTLLEGGKSVGGLVAGWVTRGGRPVEAGVHGFW